MSCLKNFNWIVLGLVYSLTSQAGVPPLMPISATADQSQTLISFSDGMIQTFPAVTVPTYSIFTPGEKMPNVVNNAAIIYDRINALPRISVMGANYAFFKDADAYYIAAVSYRGSLYYYGKTQYYPSVVGGNYFVDRKANQVVAIDSSAFFVPTGATAPKIRLAGGNFFIDEAGVLTTIKHEGLAPGDGTGILTVKTGWDFSSAKVAGGNFFVKADGTVVGINSANGFFIDLQKSDAWPKQVGGNYFIGTDNVLYTVSNKGVLKKWNPIIGQMKQFGYSYMIDRDGDFIFVDGDGVPHTEAVRVSSTGIKSELVNKISTSVFSHQSFIPQNQ
jgi:hypothetical protein